MTLRDQIIRTTDRCGNIECSNRPGEGPFAIVTLGTGNIVGGHRPFRLFLCSPCAGALTKVVTIQEGVQM